LSSDRLPELVRAANRANTYQDLSDLILQQIQTVVPLTNAWIYARPTSEDQLLHMVAFSGTRPEAGIPTVPIQGDPMVEALCRGEGPFVFEDLQQIQGVNREIVESLQNRTLVLLGMLAVDETLGVLGTGTFGEEGVVDIPQEAVAFINLVGLVASAVMARLLLRQRQEEQQKLQRELAQRQRVESLGELAGGVAHDLNNLLTVLKLGFATLEEAFTEEEKPEDLFIMKTAVDSAADLTGQLLAYGRKRPLALTSVNLDDSVEEVLRLLRRVIPPSITLDHVRCRQHAMVLADAGALQQVLMNLAINARDAMPTGGRLTFETELVLINGEYRRTHPWAQPGRYVLLTVTDTGAGMTEDVQARIFDPFFTTKSAEEGTGLGLAVVDGVVQQHGGLLHCYSEVDLGTTFKIYLPVAERLATEVGSKLLGDVRGGSERVLVADDQPMVRWALVRALERAGYDVTAVDNGRDAVRQALARPFPVYILDVLMPGLDGRQTCDLIRAAQPNARVILTSGYGAEALATAFLSDLDVSFISKPFDPDTLLRTLRAMLDTSADTGG